MLFNLLHNNTIHRKTVATTLFIGFVASLTCSQYVEYLIITDQSENGELLKCTTEQSARQPGARFARDMSQFPFANLEAALANTDTTTVDRLTEQLLIKLADYNTMEPLTPPNATCEAPDLPMPNCSAYPHLFSGPRTTPAKLGHLIQFGFDVDTLEIALRQYHGLVDKVFLIESTRAHYHQLRKPLMWEKVKHTSRFSQLVDNVVHIVLDDVGATTKDGGSIWVTERKQENVRWRRFEGWNRLTEYFGDNDVIGMGDTDEIPSRENLYLLKHCQLLPDIVSVDIGIWFPMGKDGQAFPPDFPVSEDFPYSLGDPSFFPLGVAKRVAAGGEIPTRQRGLSGKFLLGGMHMSNDGFLPFQMIKRMTCTECGFKGGRFEGLARHA